MTDAWLVNPARSNDQFHSTEYEYDNALICLSDPPTPPTPLRLSTCLDHDVRQRAGDTPHSCRPSPHPPHRGRTTEEETPVQQAPGSAAAAAAAAAAATAAADAEEAAAA